MRRAKLGRAAAGIGVAVVCAVSAATAQASSTAFERAWGTDVVTGGGTGFEICLVAADCKEGDFTGALGGDLRDPEALALSAAGNVYVVDSNARVSEFDPRGNFIRTWGKDVVAGGGTGPEICTARADCHYGGTGTLGGEFSSPIAISIAGGSVYVADNGNERIQKFDLDGNFIRAWGKGVSASTAGTGFENCTVAADCLQGVQGAGNGELDLPNGIAATASHVYVTDTDNQRVSKYDTNGTFQLTWGKDVLTGGATGFETCTSAQTCKAGVAGTLGGEFGYPYGIAAGPGGEIYVSESGNRIQKFTDTGTWLRLWGRDVVVGGTTGFETCFMILSCKIGAAGTLGGEMSSPSSLGVDAAGDVYEIDFGNERIQRFDPSGNFVETWGKDVVAGGATGAEACTVATDCKAGVEGPLGGEFRDASAIAIDPAGSAYVADESNERIDRFGTSLEPPPPAAPDNSFTIGKVKHKRVKLTLPGPGSVQIADAAAGSKRQRLKPSGATAAAAGTLAVGLKLNSKAKRLLRHDGRVKAMAAITFTPTGGTANRQDRRLKIKRAKPR